MKRLLFAVVSLVFAATAVKAQQIPVDPEVRTGKLANGMTYYVRHNEKPKGQADFYILHNVGAIQENDEQQGLAHFLEHMAFNGTKNLPDKMLIEYLEKVGVKFGANLNAATSWDYTIYNMKDVPTSRQGIIDTALLILHDWSSFITLDPAEIDKERGVIMEELRTRDGAGWRSTINMLKAVCRDSKYAERNLIGYLDGLKGFGHDQLEAFYHTWYRPDYQAVIVVGDIDADAIVTQIETLMSDIPAAAADAPMKEKYPVPDNAEPIVSIFTDPEMTQSSVSLFIRHPALPAEQRNTTFGYSRRLMSDYLDIMADSRLRDIAQSPDAPFLSANISYGGMGINPEHEGIVMSVRTEDGKLLEGFEAAYTELERIRRYGFTASEFERAHDILQREIDKEYTNRNDRRNAQFVRDYVNNFKSNDPIPEAEAEWKMERMLILAIASESQSVNEIFSKMVVPANRVIVANAPEKTGLVNPVGTDFTAVMAKVDAADIEPYKDNVVKEPLIADTDALKGSAVVSETSDEAYGTTTWTLANGARIIVKPTKLKADEVLLNAKSLGGISVLDDADYYTGSYMPVFEATGGVSKFSASDLRKLMSGKSVSVNIYANPYDNGLSANCSPKDLETMMQLLYLRFMSPRFTEDDFNTQMKSLRAQVQNMRSNPDIIMEDNVRKVAYNGNFRRQVISNEILDMINFNRLTDIHAKLFPGADSFTFTIVGNVDMETLKPLVEKYIGSIPAGSSKLTYADDGVRIVSGNVPYEFRTPMQQPKVSVRYMFSGEEEDSVENEMVATFLHQALRSRYLESIREEKGGTYGVGVSGGISKLPMPRYSLVISFDTNEAMADELCEIIMAEFEKIATEGPLDDDFNKTREFLAKQWNNTLETNNGWMRYIQNNEFYGLDNIADYQNVLKAMTKEKVRELARRILDNGNMVKVLMRPEQKAE